MADDTTTAVADQASADTSDQASQATTTTAPPADDFDKDRAMATIAKLRETEKLSKTQARELESLRQQIKSFEDSKLSDVEKRDARIAELERTNGELTTRLQEQAVRGAITSAASKFGAVYPSAAYKLIDLAEVAFDGDGEPTNIDKLLAEAKREFPLLFRNPSGSADGGSGGQAPPSGATMDQYIRRQAGIT